MRLLYWEYYRKVKERSLYASFFKKVSVNIIIFFQIITLIIETLLSVMFCNFLFNGYIGFIVEFVIILMLYMLDLRSSSVAVKMALENHDKQYYLKSMFNVDYRKYVRNACVVELFYNMSSSLALYVCLLYYMMSFLFIEKIIVLIAVALVFVIGAAFELFFMIWINKTKHVYITKFVKIGMFIIAMTFGQMLSKWILACPFIDKENTIEKLNSWRSDFFNYLDVYNLQNLFLIFLKSLVITFLFLLIFMLIKKDFTTNKEEIKLYEFKNSSLFDANFLGIVVISFVFGLLIMPVTMKKLIENNRLIFELLLITYGFFYVFDDYLAINNWVYMDYDGNAIHHWLGNINLLLKYKEKNYIKRCILPITVIYIIMNIFIVKNFLDVLIAVSNSIYIFIMAILMFYEYNLSIIDKANRIDENYAANKFSDKRIINETGVGFKIMIIGIVYILPVVFYVSGEINCFVLLVSQIGVCLLCLFYSIWQKIKLTNLLKERKWLIALYEEV